MAKKEKPQGQRFIDFAREHGADDPDALKRALDDLAHKSDCAVHDAPAMKPGRCTCGAIKERK